MLPVDQTTYGPDDGNCLTACVASILEIPIEGLPRFWGPGDPVLASWLADRGLSATAYYPCDRFVPSGFCVAAGQSKRFADRLHACVAYNGRVVHDPHPSRDGLPAGIAEYLVIHGPDGEPAWFSGV